MEGASSSIPKETGDGVGQDGLMIIPSADKCPGEAEFDLIVRPFGGSCGRCEGRSVPAIVLSTRRATGFADPRDLKRLMTRIEDILAKCNRSRIALCGVETLILWNDAARVREFLVRIDEEMRKRGTRGYLILREGSLTNEDLKMINEVLSR